MVEKSLPAWRFVTADEVEVEKLPGKTHLFHCKPGMVQDTNLLFIRAQLAPGAAHDFHHHPQMEEILYILSGTCEQWVLQEKRNLKAGDSVYIPAGVVHGTFNTTGEVLDFLAILSPAKSAGPVTVEVAGQEPYRSWRRREP